MSELDPRGGCAAGRGITGVLVSRGSVRKAATNSVSNNTGFGHMEGTARGGVSGLPMAHTSLREENSEEGEKCAVRARGGRN